MPLQLRFVPAGVFLQPPIEGRNGIRVAGGVVECTAEHRCPAVQAGVGRQAVSQLVFIRDKVAERAVSPGVQLEAYPVQDVGFLRHEELGAPAASCTRQGGFRQHGVAFEVPARHENACREPFGLFADEAVKRPDAVVSDFAHLRHVARFVEYELFVPCLRVSVGRRRGEEFHARGRPGHHAVARHVVGVQHNGQPRQWDAERRAHVAGQRVEEPCVALRRRVERCGVDDVEVAALQLAPLNPRRVFAGGVVLGGGRAGGGEPGKEKTPRQRAVLYCVSEVVHDEHPFFANIGKSTELCSGYEKMITFATDLVES